MPVHVRDNQYQGINAHLHSFFQSEGGWEMFHAAHITNLTEAIDSLLPDGYYALNEKSLQLGTLNFETGERLLSRTRPDISIHGESPSKSNLSPLEAAVPVATLPLVKIIVDDEPLPGILIYQLEDHPSARLVTRIELLSPGNKPPGTHYRQYLKKRNETLDSGVNLVELDYLHETRLPIDLLPRYPQQDDAYPYLILVNNPHPLPVDGKTLFYGFHVDDLIPRVEIPLADHDTITVDFNAVYNQTFSRNRYYGLVAVDYQQLPHNFHTYSPSDQNRIHQRMKIITNN